MTTRVVRGTLLALIAGALLLAASPAAAAELAFTEPDELKLALPTDDAKIVWLRSDAATGSLSWELVVAKKDGNARTVPSGAAARPGEARLEIEGAGRIESNAVAGYRVRVKDLDAEGIKSAQLVARVPDAAPAALDVALSEKAMPNPPLEVVLLAPLALAVIFMVARRPGLTSKEVGSVNLDFSKSFATTLTALGALLGTILSADLLDEGASPISNQGFQALNLTFGVLVLVAPLVFLVAQKKKNSTETVGGKTTTVIYYTGPTWALLVASAVTLWAVLGEVWTIFLLLGQLDAGGEISSAAITTMQVALGIGALLAVVYSWMKLKWIVDSPAGAAAPALPGGFLPASDASTTVRPSWTPL